MTIQDWGAIGEVVAAIATIATLVYLATQVRQNTRALRSSTFQAISEQMAQNVGIIASNPETGVVVGKGLSGEELGVEQRLQFRAMLVMSFRRMESVFVQHQLGSLDDELMRGFEQSLYSLLQSPGGTEWWASAKTTYNRSFVARVDEWLAAQGPATQHPNLGIRYDAGSESG